MEVAFHVDNVVGLYRNVMDDYMPIFLAIDSPDPIMVAMAESVIFDSIGNGSIIWQTRRVIETAREVERFLAIAVNTILYHLSNVDLSKHETVEKNFPKVFDYLIQKAGLRVVLIACNSFLSNFAICIHPLQNLVYLLNKEGVLDDIKTSTTTLLVLFHQIKWIPRKRQALFRKLLFRPVDSQVSCIR